MSALTGKRHWRRPLLVAVIAPVALIAALLIFFRFATPASTLMLYRWALSEPVDRRYVPMEGIDQSLALAVIVSEDARFCQHWGVDWSALWEVLDEEGRPKRGASTITMQTAKNLFLWHGRSYLRKALEIPLALALDLAWPKRRTLEVYLNIAEWGPGVFGVEAAAQRYFSRPASGLTARQSALLATALPNPNLRNPARPTRRHDRLARLVAERMQSADGLDRCL